MKRIVKLSMAVLLFALVIVMLNGFGTIRASAGSLSEDLDGDGVKEKIEWETRTVVNKIPFFNIESSFEVMEYVSINGVSVFEVTKVSIPDVYNYGCDTIVEIIDTATIDTFKEVVVTLREECREDKYIFRYYSGKITLYAHTDRGFDILSGKTKNRLKVRDSVTIKGIGLIDVVMEYKIKSGKATLVTKKTYKTYKQSNNTLSYKATEKKGVYKKNDWTEETGTIKKGEEFTIIKIGGKTVDNYNSIYHYIFTQAYIKTASGVKGWINTEDIKTDEYIVENPRIPWAP